MISIYNNKFNNITIFGSCRIHNINNNNNLNEDLNFTHTTKEVIQFINFLQNKIYIRLPYNNICFRSGIRDNKLIIYNEKYNKLFKNTDVFIIEICSRKNYIHNNYYLHYLCIHKAHSFWNKYTPIDILCNYETKIQSDEEIENDILQIYRLLYPKKIIIVSHYNSKINGKYIDSRNNLINLLSNICKKYNINFIDPSKVLSNFTQKEIIEDDLNHYTSFGINEISKYLNNYINLLLNNIICTI